MLERINRIISRNKYPLLLAIVGFVAYINNYNNSLLWDDYEFIVNNKFIQSLNLENLKNIFTKSALAGSGYVNNYYRPVLFLSYIPNYLIHGIKPFGYHLINNLVHIANGVLIYFVLVKFFNLFGGFTDSTGRLLAFLTGSVFLVHPMLVESVTYIPSRGLLLSTFFMLLTILFHFRNSIRQKWLYGSNFYVLALLSMENSVILPPLLYLCDLLFLQKEVNFEGLKKSFINTWFYFLIMIIYIILRLTVLNFTGTLTSHAQPNIYNQNMEVRLFTFSHVVLTYISLMFFPVDLHHRFTNAIHTSFWEWPVWITPSFIVLMFGLSIHYLRSAKKQEGRVMLFGVGWFLLNLIPVSGIVPLNAILQENWVYLAMIGVFVIVFYHLLKLLRHSKMVIIGTYIFVIFLIPITWKMNAIYGDELTLYERTVKYEPYALRLVNNVGNLYAKKGDFEKAEYYFKTAIERGADFPEPYSNLAAYYWFRKDYDTAEKLYLKALELNPGYLKAKEMLLRMYLESGQGDKKPNTVK